MCASLIRRAILSLFLLAPAVLPARAEIIYDNTSEAGSTNVYYAIGTVLEYGDEIILAGTDRTVSQFAFEYNGDFTPSGDETARVRFYKLDGPATPAGYPTPGTLLYDSGTFGISPGYQSKTFVGLNIDVPGSFVWTVEFGGLTRLSSDQAGLLLSDPPSVVGLSYDDFWQKDNGKWQLFRFNGNPKANFAARVTSGGAGTTVAIRRDLNKVIVEWAGLSILQVCDTVDGTYTDLPNVRNRFEINPTVAGMKFWRLRD